MSILTKYLISIYLKYFFIILVSLELFFVGVDLLQNLASLPNSANLQLLYAAYNFFYTLSITLPISLIFGWIVTITFLIKNNELVSFYALSISSFSILKPILFLTTCIILILIGLQMTPLAYSVEKKDRIAKNKHFINERSNIFLKYNDYFVYFEKLYPLEKKAENIRIFKTSKNDILEIIEAKKAYYQNNKWYVIDATLTKKPHEINWDNSKLQISKEKFLHTLEGFEPNIINNVYKAKVQFSILDAVRTILLLENQDFNTNKIKVILYSQIFIPFFVLPLIILIFINTESSSRFFNTAKFLSVSIFGTLIIWGVLFLLQKLASGGVISAELAIITPIVLLSFLSIMIYKKKENQ